MFKLSETTTLKKGRKKEEGKRNVKWANTDNTVSLAAIHFTSKRGFCTCAEAFLRRNWWNTRLDLEVLFIYYMRYYTCINISRIFHPGRNSYLRVPTRGSRVSKLAPWESEEVENGSNDLLTHHSLLCARLLFKGLLCQLNPLHIRRVQVLAADAKVILESPSCRFFYAHPLVAVPPLAPHFCY